MDNNEKLEGFLYFIVSLVKKLDEILADKKIKFFECLSLGPVLWEARDILPHVLEIPAIFKALTEEEKQALFDKFREDFDLANDAIEEVVEKAIGTLFVICDFVSAVKKAFKR